MDICLNKDFLNLNDLNGFTEIFLLVPFLSDEIYFTNLQKIIGPHNEGLYTKQFFTGKKLIQNSNIETCRYSLLPFKYNNNDSRVKDIVKNAKNNNKQVLAFYNDDNTDSLEFDSNVILFRTSLYKTRQKNNERVFPALVPDHFNKDYICNKQGISFCGCLTQIRLEVIESINKLNLQTNFIIRSGFWAPEVKSKIKARQEYNNNLLNNRYSLCIRGAGNFSYRFYEALSFGRIPILLDTDVALPFSNSIDWSKHIIVIKQEDILKLPDLLKTDTRCMHTNRKLWEEYFSVEGYTQNFIKDIDP